MIATVHYGRDYDNAFWDGTQLVFGDGDGEIFDRFTKPVDVLGHELTHAVTEHTAGLRLPGPVRARSTSRSATSSRACLKQRLLGQDAGAGRLADRRGAVPARRAGARRCATWPTPGTAYDDPRAGQGPAGRPHGRLRRDHRRQRRGAPQLRHPQPRLPAGRHRDRRAVVGGRRRDLVRRPHRRPGRLPTTDFAGFAAATVAAAGDHADAVARGLGDGRRRARRRLRRRPPATGRSPAPADVVDVRRTRRLRRPRPPRARSTSTPTTTACPRCATCVDRIDLAQRGRRASRSPTCTSTPSTSAAAGRTVPEQHLTAGPAPAGRPRRWQAGDPTGRG